MLLLKKPYLGQSLLLKGVSGFQSETKKVVLCQVWAIHEQDFAKGYGPLSDVRLLHLHHESKFELLNGLWGERQEFEPVQTLLYCSRDETDDALFQTDFEHRAIDL